MGIWYDKFSFLKEYFPDDMPAVQSVVNEYEHIFHELVITGINGKSIARKYVQPLKWYGEKISGILIAGVRKKVFENHEYKLYCLYSVGIPAMVVNDCLVACYMMVEDIL